MGGAPSQPAAGGKVTSLENRLAASGDLLLLRRAFSNLSAASSSGDGSSVAAKDLQEYFMPSSLSFKECSAASKKQFGQGLGVMISAEVFGVDGDRSLDWVGFLQGFERAVKQSLGANRLKLLLSLLPHLSGTVQTAVKESSSLVDARLPTTDIGQVEIPLGTFRNQGHVLVEAPDIEPLCRAAQQALASEATGPLPLDRLSAWILSTIPGLCDCLGGYVVAKLRSVGTSSKTGEEEEKSPIKDEMSKNRLHEENADHVETGLLSTGTAWSLGLSFKETSIGHELIQASSLIAAYSSSHLDLIYRSSEHGQGMNRFWTHVQAYKGPIMLLISAKPAGDSTETPSTETWVMGAFVPDGLDNRETFYGSSGCCLYAIKPEFLPLHASGREKCFVYSHREVGGLAYRAKPVPEGLGFGGGYGNERVWVDGDFGLVTVRHHAHDHTYHSGPLVPGQGYAPVKGEVLEVEVWGLGGKAAQEQQEAYRKRENLFIEQRRKVDLKDFAIEKSMLEMISDPNKVEREER